MGTGQRFLDLVFLDRITTHLTYNNELFFKRYVPNIIIQLSYLVISTTALFLLLLTNIKKVSLEIRFYFIFWIIFATLSISIGGYYFPHYFLEIAPLICLATFLFIYIVPVYVLPLVSIVAIYLSGVETVFPYIVLVLVSILLVRYKSKLLLHKVSYLLPILILSFTLLDNPILQNQKILKQGIKVFYTIDDLTKLEFANYKKQTN